MSLCLFKWLCSLTAFALCFSQLWGILFDLSVVFLDVIVEHLKKKPIFFRLVEVSMNYWFIFCLWGVVSECESVFCEVVPAGSEQEDVLFS
jgi:hypothetical protein